MLPRIAKLDLLTYLISGIPCDTRVLGVVGATDNKHLLKDHDSRVGRHDAPTVMVNMGANTNPLSTVINAKALALDFYTKVFAKYADKDFVGSNGAAKFRENQNDQTN